MGTVETYNRNRKGVRIMFCEHNSKVAIEWDNVRHDATELARALVNPKVFWGEVATKLKRIKNLDEVAEIIRKSVLDYMVSVILNDMESVSRARFIIKCFEEPFLNTKQVRLVRACYDVACWEGE